MNTTPESTEELHSTAVTEPVDGPDSGNDVNADDAAVSSTDSSTDSSTSSVDAGAEGEGDGNGDGEVTDAEVTDTEVTGRRGDRTEELVREGEFAADFLEALLDIADLSGDLEVDIDGNRAAVAIVDSEDGAAPRRLVGPGGQVLDALQELTRLAVQAQSGERSRLMLDVAGYRADRRAALVSSTRAVIAQVQESGERRELEPMTAFERKVVHDEVLAAGLHSESEGVEPSRYVVILPSA